MLTKEQIKHHGIKPSLLPENSVIEDIYYGKYIKEADGVWVEVHAAFGERPMEVRDNGFLSNDPPEHFIVEPADKYFGEFDIVSVPVGWKKPQPPKRPEAIWKVIPGFPDYEVSDDGRVKRTGSPSSKSKGRSKTTGNFVIYKRGRPVSWNESFIGDEAAVKAFFNN